MIEFEVEHPTVMDTGQQRVGEIYARSLLAIGQKTNQVDGLLEQVQTLADAVAKLSSFRALMESPRISFEEKSRLIDKAIGQKSTPNFTNFVKVLTRKNRFDCLPAVAAAAKKIHNEVRGRVGATLITAEPVSPDELQFASGRLAKTLGKAVELSSQVDPSIIGGAIVRVGDTVYDGSTKNQLRRARSAAVQRAHQEIRDSLGRFATEN